MLIIFMPITQNLEISYQYGSSIDLTPPVENITSNAKTIDKYNDVSQVEQFARVFVFINNIPTYFIVMGLFMHVITITTRF